MKYYFAYGTLLDINAMRSVTPTAKPLGVMQLTGVRMGFAKCHDQSSGGCTLLPEEGAVLYGMQYELTDKEMAILDKAAGVDSDLWRHRPIEVTDENGKVHQSSTYFIPNAAGPDAPSHDYVRPILNGLQALPFPDAYVTKMKQIITDAQAQQ